MAPAIAALDPLGNSDRVETWSDYRCSVARAFVHNTVECPRLETVATDPVAGDIAVVWARIDDREQLIGRVRDALADPESPTDAGLVLAAHRTWGEAAPEHLIGAFAYVHLASSR